MPLVVVVGGAVLDIHAQPLEHDLRKASTVPGKVYQLAGGVGRNIAEAAHIILTTAQGPAYTNSQQQPQQQQQQHPGQHATGSPAVQLVSAVGDDSVGDTLVAMCQQQGMSTDCIQRCPGASTACVSVINDRSGEVAAAVADVSLLEQALTPQLLQRHTRLLSSCRVLVLDANLAPPSMEAACRAAAAGGVPVLFEPVSIPKSTRCVGFLQHLTYITPNVHELLAIAQQLQPALAGQQPPSSRSSSRSRHRQPPPPLTAEQLQALPAAQQLAKLAPQLALVLRAGVQAVVLTLGAHGAALVKREGSSSSSSSRMEVVAHHIPAAEARVVNVNGAGDCLAAAFAAAVALGVDEVEAVAMGVAAGAVAVGSSSNVPSQGEGLDWQRLQTAARPLLQQAVRMTMPVAAAL